MLQTQLCLLSEPGTFVSCCPQTCMCDNRLHAHLGGSIRRFQLGRCRAIEFPGCSRVKPFSCSPSPNRSWLIDPQFRCHLPASSFLFWRAPQLRRDPLGIRLVPYWAGQFLTPRMGISLALLKVAQFGAKCDKSLSLTSPTSASLCLKTHLPLKRSQGG